jgi:tetratricopeptide (TPR) repeat protein
VVASNQGENDESLELLEAARGEFRQIGDREGEAMVTGQVGALLIIVGRLEDARLALEAALAVFQATGHRYREGVVLANLAVLAMDQGRLGDALDGARGALALAEEIHDPEGIVAALLSLGDIHRLTGDYAAARDSLERGLQESRRSALPYFTAHLLASTAAVDLVEGRVEAAVAHATEAQEAASSADVPHAGARADLLAGMARQAAGDRSAVGFLRAAAQRHADVGLDPDRLESLSVLAVALLDAGDLAAALEVVEGLLREIAGPIAPGAVEPGRVLADVHRVLVAAGDGRAADIARRAGTYLDEQSQRIRDVHLRAGFLGTPVNRMLEEIASSVAR